MLKKHLSLVMRMTKIPSVIATDDLIGVTSGKSYVYTMKVQWRESVYRNSSSDPPVDELFLPPTLELTSPVATD